MNTDNLAELVLEPLIGGHEDLLAMAQALTQVAARRGFVIEINGDTAVVRPIDPPGG